MVLVVVRPEMAIDSRFNKVELIRATVGVRKSTNFIYLNSSYYRSKATTV